MAAALTQANGIDVRTVLSNCRVIGAADRRFATCCSDPHACRPGDLFVALLGDESDGHDQAHDAVAAGAVGVVTERMLPVGVTQFVVDDTRQAYGRLCQALVGDPSAAMRTIGVAGTHGKTVVSQLLTAALRAAGLQAGNLDTLEYSDGVESLPRRQATSPPELAHALAGMQAAGCTHAVVELSCRDLAQRRAAGVQLDAAVLTNIRRGSSQLHGTQMNYRQSMCRVFEQLKPRGFAVIDADDPASGKLLARLDRPTMTVAMQADAEVTAVMHERHAAEQTFLLSAGSDMIPVRTRIIGAQHVYNCLLATATGLALGLDLPAIVSGLESVESLPRRMERIECGQPFGVFVDAAVDHDRLAAALNNVRRVTQGRVICIADACAGASREERALIGRVLEKSRSLGIVSTLDHTDPHRLDLVHDVLDGYDRPARAHVIPDRWQAIEWALRQARPGDAVLIAGSCDASATLAAAHDLPCESDLIRQLLRHTAPHSQQAA